MILKRFSKWVAVAVGLMMVTGVQAQDLLARQAPIDKKLRAIDSVALQRQIVREQMETSGIWPLPYMGQ